MRASASASFIVSPYCDEQSKVSLHGKAAISGGPRISGAGSDPRRNSCGGECFQQAKCRWFRANSERARCCRLRQRRETNKGKPEIKSSYQGATYLFASAANKDEFDQDPARYAPQYGGFCSYGVSLGVLVIQEIHKPSSFIMARLHVCGNMTSLEKFIEDIDSNVEKADRQWRRISKL